MDARVTFACWKAEKAAWVRAAQREGMKLAPWIVRALNRAARSGEQ